MKRKYLKTYLFVAILITTFSLAIVSIHEDQALLALIFVAIGVSIIIFGLYSVLDVKNIRN